MNSSEGGRALRRWLLCEHNLEVETGRFRGVHKDYRWCTRCQKQGYQEVGDEVHALGLCLRGHRKKVEVAVDLLELFWKHEVILDDDDGLDLHVSELLSFLHKLPQPAQKLAWRITSRLMLEINKEILSERDGQ